MVAREVLLEAVKIKHDLRVDFNELRAVRVYKCISNTAPIDTLDKRRGIVTPENEGLLLRLSPRGIVGGGLFLLVHEDPDCVFDGVEDDVLDLKLVLVVGVGIAESPELVGQLEAVGNVLRGDKVLCHLDARVQVPHLGNRSQQINVIINQKFPFHFP